MDLGKIQIMDKTESWKRPDYGKVQIMEKAGLWKSPDYGKSRIMEKPDYEKRKNPEYGWQTAKVNSCARETGR